MRVIEREVSRFSASGDRSRQMEDAVFRLPGKVEDPKPKARSLTVASAPNLPFFGVPQL
ncbi:hypothetical protein [Paenibacillus sp. BC26]|uniref:hypothetical protein n=1 Tax=Paenibacillus sp. BC26 TaxID=1881032 RepID=UPI0015A52E37|nr:hypothetical protein [Paenibacillus sp. BC26]